MKRAIQGLLVTSVLLVGCASSGINSGQSEVTAKSAATSLEMNETLENLQGVCNAIIEHGLPVDRQTRRHVRRGIDSIAKLAKYEPELVSIEQMTPSEILEAVARDYMSCDPVITSEVKGK